LNQPIPFGKYYLLERVNVGGMAEVFKAKAFGVEGFERLLAVKRILPNIAEDEEFITMFIDEAKIAVQLQHANIAQIFDLGKVDDSFFIALEFVHGKDLRAIFDLLRKTGDRMPTAQACFIIMQICEGLDYAHNKKDAQGRELNLVHRDVSPQNVLVGYEGELKLVDFGIAKAAGKASKTQAGILKGKFGYMSPEQVRGLPVDRRSDIFALGIVIYELLTGERLFAGESDFSTLEKVRNVEILPPSSFNKKISPELERIVLKALAKEVEDRYQNAIDLHDDLQAYLYSVGEFFSRKDLASWMKKTFGDELAEENAKNLQYERLEEPTPAPGGSSTGSRPKARAAREGSKSQPKPTPGLAWDEEELETQIFDRAPPAEAQDSEKDAELTSADILLQEQDSGTPLDDKTAIAPPPDEIMADAAAAEGLAASGGSGMARPLGGPPPGLSAYRHTLSPPGGTPFPGTPGPAAPWGGQHSPSSQRPAVDGMGAGPPVGSPFRQTIMGMPQMGLGMPQQPYGAPAPMPTPYPHSPYPERRPLATFTQQRRAGRRPMTTVLVLGILAGAVLLGYSYFTRAGKLTIVVTPSDAVVTIDDQALKGPSPITVERAPGTYNLTFKREGYVPQDKAWRIEPGTFERLEVQLEASADTGFELTSDPPQQLVWLDGQPFTGKDPNGPQARTDFKAYPVTPGKHVLEIKGDARFKPWRQEFFQEPGKTLKISATLETVPGSGTWTPAGTASKTPVTEKVVDKAAAAAVPAAAKLPDKVAEKPAEKPAEKTPEKAPGAPPVAAKTPEKAPAAAKTAEKTPAAAPVGSPPKPAAPEKTAAADKPKETPASHAPTSPAAPAPKPTPFGEDTHAAAATRVKTPNPKRTVAARDPATSAAPPPAPVAAGGDECVMTVGSKPWSQVWLDGKNTQKLTPLVDFKVACGRHKLTLKNGDLGIEQSETITVKAGEKYKKIFQLLPNEE
jgi:serine/threonine protein kinase